MTPFDENEDFSSCKLVLDIVEIFMSCKCFEKFDLKCEFLLETTHFNIENDLFS